MIPRPIKAPLKAGIRLFKRTGVGRGRALGRHHDQPLKLNIGSGATRYPGWRSIEIRELDIRYRVDWAYFLGDQRPKAVFAEHVFEHLSFRDTVRAFAHIGEFLAPGGVFRFAVPDGNHPSGYYRELTGPGGIGWGGDDHHYFFTIGDVPLLERASGLRAQPLEYFDDEGRFVGVPFDDANGPVVRSAFNYRGPLSRPGVRQQRFFDTIPPHLREQFHEQGMTYTSLLIDWHQGAR